MIITGKLYRYYYKRPCIMSFIVSKPEETKPSFTSELTASPAKEGEPYRLYCRISGEPKPTMTWFKDGDEIPLSNRVKSTFDGQSCELSFTDLTLDDSGNYKCVIANDLGKVESSAEVDVKKRSRKPEVVERMNDVDITEKEDARLEVKLSGYPTPDVQWYRGRKKIKEDDRITLEKDDDGVYALNIKDANVDDSDVYKCVASNDAGDTEVKAELKIKEKKVHPEFEDVEFEEPLIVKENEELSAELKIKGKPKPEVTWFKDDKPLRETTNLKLTSRGDVHKIRIPIAKVEDAGTYKCEAKNDVVSTTKLFEVQVEGKALRIFWYLNSLYLP